MNNVNEREVMSSVHALLGNYQKLVERNPEQQIKGDDFDALLQRARRAFPSSEALLDVRPIDGTTTLAVLIGRLSIIQGAIRAITTTRTIEELDRQNREAQRRF